MMIGIGERVARTHSATEFLPLLGFNRHSLGLAHNGFFHSNADGENSSRRQFCQALPQDTKVTVGVLFYGPGKWLAYSINGAPLKVAYRGVESGTEFFPMVSRFINIV